MTAQEKDRERRVVVTAEMAWRESPTTPAVKRKRLEQEGPAESGRVTSLVRYEPGARFPLHEHPEGEEILVLSGTFSDERGDWPAGSYLLNPEGSRHAPCSNDGCELFVKLRQYGGSGRAEVALDTRMGEGEREKWEAVSPPDVERLALYSQPGFPERMWLLRIAPGGHLPLEPHPGGKEIFVVRGSFEDEDGHYESGTWLKLPPGGHHSLVSETGCLLYVKENHLL